MLKKKTTFVMVQTGNAWAVAEESCELEGVSGTGPPEHTHNRTKWRLLLES